jgi:hypothetical protein
LEKKDCQVLVTAAVSALRSAPPPEEEDDEPAGVAAGLLEAPHAADNATPARGMRKRATSLMITASPARHGSAIPSWRGWASL